MATVGEHAAQLYIGYFNRAPDPEGLVYWVARLGERAPVESISESFAASPEARALYSYFDTLDNTDTAAIQDFLKAFYRNVFGREADDDGLNYYTAQVRDGVHKPAHIAASILTNASTNEGSADQAYLANKVKAGLIFAASAGSLGDRFVWNEQSQNATRDMLAGITGDAATVEEARAKADAFVAANGGDAGDSGPVRLSLEVRGAEKSGGSNETRLFTLAVIRSGDLGDDLTVSYKLYEHDPYNLDVIYNEGAATGGTVTIPAGKDRVSFAVSNPVSFTNGQVFSVRLQPDDAAYDVDAHDGRVFIRGSSYWTAYEDGQGDIVLSEPRFSGRTDVSYETVSVSPGSAARNIAILVAGGEAVGSSGYISAYVRADDNTVYAGEGHDTIAITATGGTAASQNGSAEDVSSSAGIYSNTVYGGEGDDTIAIAATGGTATNQNASASASGFVERNTVYSGEGNDTVTITATGGVATGSDAGSHSYVRNNTVHGGDGNDIITIAAVGGTATKEQGRYSPSPFVAAGAESNTVYGGEGNDTITVAANISDLRSGSGQNFVGHSVIHGGGGHDTITISATSKAVAGDPLNPNMSSAGSNTVHGDDGDDIITIFATSEMTAGDSSKPPHSDALGNTVHGDDGNDIITISATAEAGDAWSSGNTVYGGDGNDVVIISATAQSGNAYVATNNVTGGAGADIFAFRGKVSYEIDRESFPEQAFQVGSTEYYKYIEEAAQAARILSVDNANIVADFNHAEGDRIALGDAGSDSNFARSAGAESDHRTAVSVAQAAFADDDSLLYYFAAVGEDGFLFYDPDGDSLADNVLRLTGVRDFSYASLIAWDSVSA